MKHFTLFILLLLCWFLLTMNLKTENIVVGVACALIVTLFFGKYFVHNVGKFLQPKRYLWGILYMVIFLWECIKANFDVAYRVMHPALPINPGIVKVKLNIRSGMARAMLSNSITMTPGTITVDIVDDYIYIHWINVTSMNPEEYAYKICGKFEKYIGRIFE